MLTLCSKLLVLGEEPMVNRTIHSVASDMDIKVLYSTSITEKIVEAVLDYEVVFAYRSKLSQLQAYKDKIVVVRPGSFVRPILREGFDKFLFNENDENEVYRNLYYDKYEPENNVVAVDGFVMDFKHNSFKLNGEEVYISKAEREYLRLKYFFLDDERASSKRVNLVRMRKRFGPDFLVKKFGVTIEDNQCEPELGF
jgi:hypothetical protein